jgi:hypothetical protein
MSRTSFLLLGVLWLVSALLARATGLSAYSARGERRAQAACTQMADLIAYLNTSLNTTPPAKP